MKLVNSLAGRVERPRLRAVGDGQSGCRLGDDTLLEICRVTTDDPQNTATWRGELRRAVGLCGAPDAEEHARLEDGLTLLAAALGQLPQCNPTLLPFGYSGPTIEAHGWIDCETLERVGKQIVGMLWPHSDADDVAVAVEHAISEAVRLGFLEQRRYDAWRPGMPSGSGWQWAVSATPYGAMKARAARSSCTGKRLSRKAQTSSVAVDTALQIGARGESCCVLGNSKKPLTDAQHAVILALLAAGDEGLSKDALEAIRPSARRILKRLRNDADWAKVIVMPGQTNGRYRLRSTVHQRPPLITDSAHH